MLKNVIFDFGNVLYRYDPITLLRCCFEEADLPLAERTIYREWHTLDAGTADYDEYVERTMPLLPERLHAPARRFFRDWFRFEKPIEPVWELIARLKARGYGVYLLSNAPTNFAAALGEFPILKLFDGLVVSAPIRMLKPDANIYLYALDKFHLSAPETLFVDDLEVNVEGARKCGLHGFVFDGDAAALWNCIEALS